MLGWLRVVALMLVASVTASCATGRELSATELPETMIAPVERNVQFCYDYAHNRPMRCSIDLSRALPP